ncbi:helix-turn-helix transcriptional regulator [Lignipirellula cremea]|uniref:Uncharacterized protein n=1 Tax=Lignipirellula cremea TaxID=2528010 RepID=A0A518DQE8_9BACT|nr:hypothetical protein [Lignipirellula cremea]QDU94065.1 hypothetical protein Pla8534_18510 [Lignipirellula cremea]QDU96218.1 hypothetical protein Pla8534_40370 [Lignipirellula cremea]
MDVKIVNDNRPKAAITVSRMCSLLSMSRSQFYWHVKKGTFHSPLRLTNGRPYFNASQVEDNLKAREVGIGVNGEYVLFYERDAEPKTPASKPVEKPHPKMDYGPLLDNLSALGLTGMTTTLVAAAVEACFPKGTAGEDENDVLRTVFRHLKRAGSG